LDAWRTIVKKATWKHLAEVWQNYPDMDAVRARSGRQVLVFNIRRNDYRLVAAAHFNRQIIYVMRFMTHAEYSKNRWKDSL
jgi:mRNA interferase HigB